VEVNLATGVALDGEGGIDTLIGIEQVNGSAFGDLLIGSSTFNEYFIGGAGNDAIQGAGGFDRAEYNNATAGVVINLGAFGGPSNSTATVSGDASVGFDSLLDVEVFIGSDYADTLNVGSFLSGSSPGGFFGNFNSFEGRGGDDVISGNGATRVEYTSAAGAVTVDLAAGTGKAIDMGDTSVDTDTFTGVNQVRGSSFADTLTGGNSLYNGFEGFDGRGGNDSIDGGQGWDRAEYSFNGAVATGITVNLAAGTVTGDPVLTGTDTLRGIEAIRGSHLADLYDATDFSGSSTNAGWNGTLNEFEGLAGNDTIIGNGSTRIAHGLAREGVSVDLGTGTVTGGASVGTDTILGGVNAASGSNFDDVLIGSASSDSLNGLSGNDLLRGGSGNDFINGGAGSDRIDFDSLLDAGDTISGFTAGTGGDVLDIADLLQNWTSYAGGTGGLPADFVQVTAQGSDGLLQIDADGSATDQGWQTLATLIGGSALDFDTLLSQGNIDVLV
jgi:Ca2+-binding RTX toxin-like protein